MTRPSTGRKFWLRSETVQPPLAVWQAPCAELPTAPPSVTKLTVEPSETGLPYWSASSTVILVVSLSYCKPSILYFSALIDIDFWIGRPVEMVSASDRPLIFTPLRLASAVTRTGVGIVPDDTIVMTLPLASVVARVGETVRPPV